MIYVGLCRPKILSAKDLFTDYAYFSSYSASWVTHAKEYAERMVENLGLNPESTVCEIASNDGSPTQFFKKRILDVLA